MNAILLTLFVSFGIVALSLLAFGFLHRQRDLEHGDRLSLLPLEDDAALAGALAPTEPAGPARNELSPYEEKEPVL